MMRAFFLFLVIHYSVLGQVNDPPVFKNSFVIPSMETKPSASQSISDRKQSYQNGRNSKMNSDNLLPDSILIDKGNGQQWIENQEKYEYEYDLQGNIVIRIHYKKLLVNGVWVKDFKDEIEYNDLNLATNTVKKIWNSIAQNWDNSTLSEEKYNTNGKRTYNASYNWNDTDNSWVGVIKIERDFDEMSNEILNEQYRWNSELNDWEPHVKSSFDYDSDSKLIGYGYYDWNTIDEDWFNFSKADFTYNGLIGEGFRYQWDENLNDWRLFEKEERIYNEELKVEAVSSYHYFDYYPDPIWKPSSKYEYSYDDYGNITLQLSYKANSNGDWVYNHKIENRYSSKDTDLSASYDWDKNLNLWVGTFKYERLRDNDGNQILFTTYGWNSSTNTWKEATKNQSEYNEGGNIDKITYYKLENEVWVNSSRRKYYYQQEEVITSLGETHLPNSTNEFILFPNPATHQVELKFDNQNILWSVLSLNGMVLSKGNMSLHEDSNNLIDISALAPGMYLIEIQSGSSIVRRKFIKE